jgi:hypothetical protein
MPMFDLDKAIDRLRPLFKRESEEAQKREGSYNNPNEMEIQERLDALLRGMIRETLQDLLRFPPHHSRHEKILTDFYGKDRYEQCVFIMTKFPQGDTGNDKKLDEVIRATSAAVKRCGYSPRIASEREHHSILWDNVEIYLLGCSKGIAIIEDRYRPELNPNVALEAGWMRGMGKASTLPGRRKL